MGDNIGNGTYQDRILNAHALPTHPNSIIGSPYLLNLHCDRVQLRYIINCALKSKKILNFAIILTKWRRPCWD